MRLKLTPSIRLLQFLWHLHVLALIMGGQTSAYLIVRCMHNGFKLGELYRFLCENSPIYSPFLQQSLAFACVND